MFQLTSTHITHLNAKIVASQYRHIGLSVKPISVLLNCEQALGMRLQCSMALPCQPYPQATPNFQYCILKNWEWPGDQAKSIHPQCIFGQIGVKVITFICVSCLNCRLQALPSVRMQCYGSHSVYVCLAVTTLAATYMYLIYMLNTDDIRVLMVISMYSRITLCLNVLVTFADLFCLPCFLTNSQWTKEAVMVFQAEYVVCRSSDISFT